MSTNNDVLGGGVLRTLSFYFLVDWHCHHGIVDDALSLTSFYGCVTFANTFYSFTLCYFTVINFVVA